MRPARFVYFRPGGRFIFPTPNARFPLAHPGREFTDACSTGVQPGVQSSDLQAFRDRSTVALPVDSGRSPIRHGNERDGAPSGIRWLMRSLGFDQIAIHGCAVGAFSRGRPLTPDDFEMLVLARKTPADGS